MGLLDPEIQKKMNRLYEEHQTDKDGCLPPEQEEEAYRLLQEGLPPDGDSKLGEYARYSTIRRRQAHWYCKNARL